MLHVAFGFICNDTCSAPQPGGDCKHRAAHPLETHRPPDGVTQHRAEHPLSTHHQPGGVCNTGLSTHSRLTTNRVVYNNTGLNTHARLTTIRVVLHDLGLHTLSKADGIWISLATYLFRGLSGRRPPTEEPVAAGRYNTEIRHR